MKKRQRRASLGSSILQSAEIIQGDVVFHYTDDAGYKAISSQVEWRFKASQPPGEHESGTYFTNLPPNTARLASRLEGLPREKTEFVFCFRGLTGLKPVTGGRGEFICYSSTDYVVGRDRQVFHGAVQELKETWK